jgi:UDP-N-acetylmuramoylalanine--D-glutamate ligase
MKNLLQSLFRDKKVMILGYGREGKSTFRLLRGYFPELPLAVADKNENLETENPELTNARITLFTGNNYTENLKDFDIVIKSPGISVFKSGLSQFGSKITSQTDLFLRCFAPLTTGITGTKGKSTTSSLLYHIINGYTSNTLLAGNIGIPLFELVESIDDKTRIICEMSSHQLEYISRAPSTSVLLNIFQEHLDHYASYKDYQLAKFQIAVKQVKNGNFIFNPDDQIIAELLKEIPIPGNKLPAFTSVFAGDGAGKSGKNIVLRRGQQEQILIPANPQTQLAGKHNLRNITIAAAAARISDIPAEAIIDGIATFKPLKHRIEFLGINKNKLFYNDSISTIPEATLAALDTLQTVHTLILGGFDRDIDYEPFIKKLCKSGVNHIVFTGPAGERMMKLLSSANCHKPVFEMGNGFNDAVKRAIAATPEKCICLLSPAASSYDNFRNFEERGIRFEEIVMEK